ncbi:MAG: carboxypeptidase-like regulatory domain-containing protein [Planctomycetota bacterium]|nr:carboxypeptidase-like regulatory domain-containing protein [Planctomycetota bacterium]
MSPQQIFWKSRFIKSASLLFLLSLAGCGGGVPALGTVGGTVTANGKPLANAYVEFQPTAGQASYGVTDANGKYSLFFRENHPGAVLGEHKVSIRTKDFAQDNSEDGVGSVELVPQAYNQYTILKAVVKAGENPPIDFKIEYDEQAYAQLVQVRKDAQARQVRGFALR